MRLFFVCQIPQIVAQSLQGPQGLSLKMWHFSPVPNALLLVALQHRCSRRVSMWIEVPIHQSCKVSSWMSLYIKYYHSKALYSFYTHSSEFRGWFQSKKDILSATGRMPFNNWCCTLLGEGPHWCCWESHFGVESRNCGCCGWGIGC